MFWSIFSPILSSFSTIYRKKSLSQAGALSPVVVNSFGNLGYLFILIYLLFAGKISFTSTSIEPTILLIVMFVSLFWIAASFISEYVYKNEKISVITPYENLNKVLSIIVSYFIFGDVSLISLILGVLVVCLIIGVSIDFKKLEMPRFIKLFSFHQLLFTANTILIGYALKTTSSIDYFVLENIFMIFLYTVLISYRREVKDLFKGDRKFYQNRFLASILDAGAYFISLYIIASIGVMMNILISFLYIACILMISFLFFGDRPDKKSIILSVAISGLVGLAFYFNT